jgi:hypothetical protein
MIGSILLAAAPGAALMAPGRGPDGLPFGYQRPAPAVDACLQPIWW